jgi:hypothetical protein
MAPPFSSSDYTTTSSGGALTENSVTTSNIINRTITGADIALGTIKGENIEAGTIEAGYLDPAFLTYLTNLENKVLLLEQTAVLRSFDTLVGSPTAVSNFTIPVDLVNNESVEIDINMKVFGTNLVNLRAGINSASLTNQDFDEYNGIIREGSASTIGNTPFNKSQGNGAILINVESQGLTSVIRMKLYRTHSLNDNFSRYQFESKSVYCKAGIGVATVETVGMINDLLPTAIYLFFPSSATTMTASYSIINDKRRTFFNGITS